MDLITIGFKKKHRSYGIFFFVIAGAIVGLFLIFAYAQPDVGSDLSFLLLGVFFVGVPVLLGVYQILKMNNYKVLYSVLKGGKEEFDIIANDFENPEYESESMIIGKKYLGGTAPLKKEDTFAYLDKVAIIHPTLHTVTKGLVSVKDYRVYCYEEGTRVPKIFVVDQQEIAGILEYFNENYEEVFVGYNEKIIEIWEKNPYKKEFFEQIKK